MNTKHTQCGFKVIELVVVITILGILAAFAVPRFVPLEEQAREAAVDAVAGSVRSGAALAHAMWLASGRPASVQMDGAPAPGVAVNAQGYPTAASIVQVLSDSSGYTFDGNGVFTMDGSPGAECSVTYALDAQGFPVVTVDKDEC